MRYEATGSASGHVWLHLLLCGVLVAGAALPGCSTLHYRTSADEEVYEIIRQKTPEVPGMPAEFSIEHDEVWDPLEGLDEVAEHDEALGEDYTEAGARVVTLERALSIAVRMNRNYQSQRESLYLQGLSLTLDRHNYTPIFSGSLDYGYDHSSTETQVASDLSTNLTSANAVIGQLESLTGQPATLLRNYTALVASSGALVGALDPQTVTVDDRSVSGSAPFATRLLLKGGGQLVVNLTSNFLRFITGDPTVTTQTALAATFTQPLLRGAGRKVAAERLTQAERDMLYSLREFTRFRKTFSVDVCSQYYNVLQARDRLRNNYNGYLRFEESLARERAMFDEGRSSQTNVGLIEQNALNSKNGWINALGSYRRSLDNLKIQLGLRTDENIVLDSEELTLLAETGLKHPNVTAEDAVEVALVTRLDLYNARDRAIDAERGVYVAADALKPGLDVEIAGSLRRGHEGNVADRDAWGAGVVLDLPLDRKSERNSYRSALIGHDRALRNLSLAEDQTKLDVRESWRNLEQARMNFEVAEIKVGLAERRVEEQKLLSDMGRALARDLIDAQNDLTENQNDLTDALITHTIARLRFWSDMGILFIKEDGQWEEVSDVVTN